MVIVTDISLLEDPRVANDNNKSGQKKMRVTRKTPIETRAKVANPRTKSSDPVLLLSFIIVQMMMLYSNTRYFLVKTKRHSSDIINNANTIQPDTRSSDFLM